MAEIIVTSTADSGAGSLRSAIVTAQDGDVILFDADVFPQGQTTSILLSSYITVNKSISIYGGESDGQGGYTSGATKKYYVYRDVEGVKTKVYVTDDNPALESETVLFENICRVALDGQDSTRLFYQQQDESIIYSGISFVNAHGPSGSSGGAGQIQRGQTVFRDCDFSVCHSEVQGGAVAAVSHDPVVVCYDSNFHACNAPNGGVSMSAAAGQVILNNCIIDGCSAINGAGVYSATTSQNTLNDCIITGCNATGGVGVYSAGTSQNTLNDCTISNCSAGNGGALYNSGSSQITLNRCTVKDNAATTYGGAALLTGTSESYLNNCSVINCSATSNGGAFRLHSSSSLTLNNCRVENCSGAIGGLASLADTSSGVFNDSVAIGCSVRQNGGAINAANSSNAILNNCRIMNCDANSYGGGVYAGVSSNVTLNDCEITQNTANNGGGICAYNQATVNINNCIIKDNITTATDQTQKDVSIIANSFGNITASEFGALRISQTATATFVSGVTTAQTARLLRQNSTSPSITINDGAALSFTDSAIIPEDSTFISEGRGYLAVAPRINTSLATFENVVLCAYGADVSSFAEVDGVLEWIADDPSVSVLLEREDNDAWTTLAQTTGESLDYYLPPKVNLRLFDGERFLTTATPDSRTYFYIGGAEGSFDDAEDWSLTKDGTAIPQSPTITDCAFVIQGAEGDVAISKGSANVTNATIIPSGTNNIAVTVDEATVLAGTERFTGTLTTTGDVAINGDASKLAIVVDGTLEVAGSLKLATLTLTSGSSVVFASADDVLVVTGSVMVNDATFSCEEPTAYFTAPVGTDLTQATFTNVYVATKGAEVVSVTGSRFGKNYSINIISEDNTLPVTVEYRLEGTTEWIVADPAFVGTTFQIRLDDEATFRVYNGEKFTEATMKVYGLYNEMAAIVEIGYLI